MWEHLQPFYLIDSSYHLLTLRSCSVYFFMEFEKHFSNFPVKHFRLITILLDSVY